MIQNSIYHFLKFGDKQICEFGGGGGICSVGRGVICLGGVGCKLGRKKLFRRVISLDTAGYKPGIWEGKYYSWWCGLQARTQAKNFSRVSGQKTFNLDGVDGAGWPRVAKNISGISGQRGAP